MTDLSFHVSIRVENIVPALKLLHLWMIGSDSIFNLDLLQGSYGGSFTNGAQLC